MRTVEADRIAKATANISAAMSAAYAERIAVSSAGAIIDSVRRQAKAQNVILDITVDDLASGIRKQLQIQVLAALLAAETRLTACSTTTALSGKA